ncbi:MAG: glycine/sarcosine/betaine reductase selenoprotein B family protein [Pseudomonadales bacterium]|nr:glycine/sarcosine/betaine reductase selenoprotein B family protein [Pseudomonadales bacterium]
MADSTTAPQFVPYMERTRLFYRAQGFKKDYKWAHFETVPFSMPKKRLEDCIVTVVTTAVAHPQIPKPIRTAESIPFGEAPENFDTSELSWDKETTHTDDRQSYFPVEVLNTLASEGVIKSVSERFHFVPTQYSQNATINEDAPSIGKACQEDEVDIALLIPL